MSPTIKEMVEKELKKEEYSILVEQFNQRRKIEKLNNILVEQFDKAVKSGNFATDVDQNVVISFDIECIPAELRGLFIERMHLLWGEISNNEKAKRKKYFYCKWIQIEEGNTVTAKLIRNW